MGTTTVTLEWDPPQGTGQQAMVDLYRISLTPPLPGSIAAPSSPWNVTLERNVAYNISIVAENCAGQSTALTLQNIIYSKQRWFRFSL